MTGVIKSLSHEQVVAWLRGLLTLAWADGQFDAEEQRLIADLTQTELAPELNLGTLEPITSSDLALALGQSGAIAEDFLRTAVMVAVADGTYSTFEDEVLHQFCQALGQDAEVLQALRLTLHDPEASPPGAAAGGALPSPPGPGLDPLHPLKDWLDQMDIHDPRVARFLCKMIPPQCPFERDVALFGRKVIHIPPLCKLNPLYEQLVGLRFRSLSYLADDCGEDVSPYC